jgi:hypothetical protein
MFSGLSDEVSFEDPLPASPPENPEPHPVSAIAPARTSAPAPIAARVLCRVMSLLP